MASAVAQSGMKMNRLMPLQSAQLRVSRQFRMNVLLELAENATQSVVDGGDFCLQGRHGYFRVRSEAS